MWCKYSQIKSLNHNNSASKGSNRCKYKIIYL